MLKFLKSLGVVALLSVLPLQVNAAVVDSTEADFGFDAAGEVSGTLNIKSFGEVTVFINGTYSVANVVWLQREAGSPGSGAWENILQVAGTGSGLAANGTAEYNWTNGPNRRGYRLAMTAAGTGDVMGQMTDRAQAAVAFKTNDVTSVYQFDDFNTETTAVNAAFYIAVDNDASGTIAVVTIGIQEGGITQVSGTGNDGADEACFGNIVVSSVAGLVSDGPIIFETRFRVDVLTGNVGMSLVNTECPAATNASRVFDVDSDAVVFLTGSYQDAVTIAQQGEASANDNWIAASALADAEGNDGGATGTGLEYELGLAVAGTYSTLRVETSSEGDCYFYVDDNLQYAEDQCVATTARLGWLIWVNTSDDDNVLTTQIIDYIAFQHERPDT